MLPIRTSPSHPSRSDSVDSTAASQTGGAPAAERTSPPGSPALHGLAAFRARSPEPLAIAVSEDQQTGGNEPGRTEAPKRAPSPAGDAAARPAASGSNAARERSLDDLRFCRSNAVK
jgi:hypothetical protein